VAEDVLTKEELSEIDNQFIDDQNLKTPKKSLTLIAHKSELIKGSIKSTKNKQSPKTKAKRPSSTNKIAATAKKQSS